jgi:UDP-N-acetylmuramoylalanine--D-glutamate ligase
MRPNLVGKKVLVVGLGRSGVAAARLLATEGAEVTVTDRRSQGELSEAIRQLDGVRVKVSVGGHAEKDFTKVEMVVLSPGVPMSLPEIQAARRAGIPVLAEVELAYRYLKGAPLVAITGTNGKSTTTALTGALCREDRRTFVGGNLGTPLCEYILSGRPADLVVAELSSFQLEGIEQLRPRVAVVLNVTPDHLDRYPDVDGYAAAKARIFMNQQPDDFAICNGRDARTVAMAKTSRAQVLAFGTGVSDRLAHTAVQEEEGALTYVPRKGAPERYQVRNRALRGRHNRENAMAALLCARLMEVPPEAVQRGLDGYPGLPHRLEVVRELDGVEYVNDSKATNVDSTAVGLSAFGGGGKPTVVLIMGGRGKGAPYTPLRDLFAGRVKALLTVGEDAPAIGKELEGACPIEPCTTLERAVAEARRLAGAGDVVLLSPACASYDQFKNYEERGDTFRRLVGALG